MIPLQSILSLQTILDSIMIRTFLLAVFIKFCLCHSKDQECFPVVKSQSSDDSKLSIDITHTHTDRFGFPTVKSEKRITLSGGESTTVSLYAESYSKFNPREIYVKNNNGRIEKAMASMSYFYNSVLVDSTTDWNCWNSSNDFDSNIFSTYGTYRHEEIYFDYDVVDLVVVEEGELSGTDQDIQCFNKIKPNDKGTRKTEDKISVKVGITQKADQWESVNENLTVSLAQGEKKVIQTNYSLYNEPEFGNHNPRNLTLLFSGDNLYAAMAFQSEFTYMVIGQTTNEVEKPPFCTTPFSKAPTFFFKSSSSLD